MGHGDDGGIPGMPPQLGEQFSFKPEIVPNIHDVLTDSTVTQICAHVEWAATGAAEPSQPHPHPALSHWRRLHLGALG